MFKKFIKPAAYTEQLLLEDRTQLMELDPRLEQIPMMS